MFLLFTAYGTGPLLVIHFLCVGVRMLDGVVNDAVEARALSLNPSHIDIYSGIKPPDKIEYLF